MEGTVAALNGYAEEFKITEVQPARAGASAPTHCIHSPA